MRNLSVIGRRMRLYAEHALANEDLGFPEQSVLMCLGTYGTSRQEDIAGHLSLDKGSVAKAAAKLEKKKLITRTVNPQDKREKFMDVTPEGASILAHMEQTYLDLEKRMFVGLTQEELDVTRKVLSHVAANLAHEPREGEE